MFKLMIRVGGVVFDPADVTLEPRHQADECKNALPVVACRVVVHGKVYEEEPVVIAMVRGAHPGDFIG